MTRTKLPEDTARVGATYRGLRVYWYPGSESSRYVASVSTIGYVYGSNSARTRKNPPTRKDMRKWVDMNWPEIQQQLVDRRIESCDGLPWELHGIEDPKARAFAINAFKESSL